MTIKQYTVEAIKDSPVALYLYAWWASFDMNRAAAAAGFLYALFRLAWLGVECYWKWKDRQHGNQGK